MVASLLLTALLLFSADFVVCADSSHQIAARALFRNSQYCVFWSDQRFAPSRDLFGIFAARITTGGQVLDPHGKQLYLGIAKFEPQVAFDGTNFLVAFRDGC
jgi:hypothetical protein